MRDITLEDTFYMDFTTRAFATGIPTVLAGTPVLSVLEENNATPITAGVSISVDRASVVGLNMATIVATAANGYEDGKGYSIYISTGTVGGVSVIGEVVGQFTIGKFNAISEAVASIGSATGGGFKFAPVSDDVLEDTINDAEAAVDKSTTPATVGIPVTGHAFLAGDEVTIAGTTNYNASVVVDSVTTNEVVIVSSFTAETFSSSDTIKRTIKATRLVGTQDGGTFASVAGQDLVYHIIGDTSNNFTISYRFAVGGGRLGTEIDFTGYLNSNNDTGLIQAYDFVGSAWETRATFDGQNGSVNQSHNAPLLARNTGTSGVELGQVLIRIKQGASSSSPTLNTDSLLVEAVGVAILGLHENGAIWIDTDDGTAGTEEGVNGTSDNPVKTWADAQTMLTATGRHNIHVINGSTITLDASVTKYSFFGDNWTLVLAGQTVTNAHIQGASVSGTHVGACEFTDCDIGTMTTIADTEFEDCHIDGTVTLPAGDVFMSNCHHGGTAIVDFGAAVGSTTLHMHKYAGEIELQNFGDNGTDILHLDGNGKLTINANSSGGTVHLRGSWQIANSASGVTINYVETAELTKGTADSGTTTTMVDSARTEADTDYWKDMRIRFTSGTIDGQVRLITAFTPGTDTITFAPATTQAVGTNTYEIVPATLSGGMSTGMKAEVNAEVDTALNTAIPASLTADSINERITSMDDGILNGTVDTATNSHTPTTTEFQADDITEATADHFIGRIVTFLTGALADQSTDITDYAAVGGIAQFTVTAMTDAPANNDKFKIT